MIVRAADHMLPVKFLIAPGHFPKSLSGIGENDLRCLEGSSCLKIPAEVLRTDPHRHADRIKLAAFHLSDKISGINKMHTVNFSAFLIRSRSQKCNKRMLLMAGFSPEGGYQLFSISQGTSLDMAFSCPGTVKAQHLKILIIHIHTGTVDLFHTQRLIAFIYQADAPCNHILFFKNRITQDHLQAKDRILTDQIQSLHFFLCTKGSRKSLQFLLAFVDLITFIKELTAPASLCITDIQAALPEIPHTAGGILGRKTVQKGGFFPLYQTGRKGMLIDAKQIIFHLSFQAVSIINMAYIPFCGKTYEIRSVFRLQTEDFFLFFIRY